MLIKSKILKRPDCLEDCFKVRYEVFVDEQGFDKSIELDELDDVAYHVLITDNDKPIATARYFSNDDNYKIGRVCVLKEYRGLKLGNYLLECIEKHLKEIKIKKIVLNAQYDSKNFYFKNGYEEIGEIFYEEGCKHIKMFKNI